MLAQTVNARKARSTLRRKAFDLATNMMPTIPPSQVAWKSFKIRAMRSMIALGVDVRTARSLFRTAYRLFRKQQRGGVGQHQRH